jgi:hypothetical protein
VLVGSVSGHLVQTLPYGGNYQTHNSIWLRDLGVELVTDRFGEVGGGSRPYFSGVSFASRGQFRNPLFRQSLASTHFALRSFSTLSLSFVELDLFVTLPSKESGIAT